MPKITALIHASNDERRIGRALESLRVCDQVVVVDHGSTDRTAQVAREHGATVKSGVPGVQSGAYVVDADHDWVLCLLPSESLGESLEAELHEWKHSDPGDAVGYCMELREETENGWRALPPELRLVNRARINWRDQLPPNDSKAVQLAGAVLRFLKP